MLLKRTGGWRLNDQKSLVTQRNKGTDIYPCSTHWFTHTQDDWNSSDRHWTYAPVCRVQIGSESVADWLIWKQVIYWIPFLIVDRASKWLDLVLLCFLRGTWQNSAANNFILFLLCLPTFRHPCKQCGNNLPLAVWHLYLFCPTHTVVPHLTTLEMAGLHFDKLLHYIFHSSLCLTSQNTTSLKS